jgi:uncharacterized membrane protein YccC
MPAHRLLRAMPMVVINGIGVSLGVALIQGGVGMAAGTLAAFAASSGAVLSSLADVPTTPRRTWHRVATAALFGCAASLLIALLRPFPVLLGLATALLAFAGSLCLAWGPRAGPIAFVPILALVFTLAGPPPADLRALLEHVAWTACGAAAYLVWATAVSAALQPRYRLLASAEALRAAADLLRSRARLITQEAQSSQETLPLQAWIRSQAVLDDRVQVARDLLFEATDRLDARRQIALLLLTINLRDTLMASELDLDLLGHDAPAEALRSALVANLQEIAEALDAMAEALRDGSEPAWHAICAQRALDAARPTVAAIGAERAALAAALLERAQHMQHDLECMRAVWHDRVVDLALQPAELQLFVSPEAWSLASLRRHLRGGSPVLRHAVRSAVALGIAYFVAEALPWTSHPHWLVLSVAVVLRGNLEQTLARRDARVAGTVIGCAVVMVLARIHAPGLSNVVFLCAVGIAHAYVTRRYLVTAAAATVMALLQAHLADPAGGFDVVERLADTALGAMLAWGFSYVLPAWEQRSVAALVSRVLGALGALAREGLRWPDGAAPELALRLARRDAYDAIGSIAAAAQRTGAEPEKVRVPLHALAVLLVRSHVLLAHLAAVRTLLTRSAAQLPREEAAVALRDASAEVERLLESPAGPGDAPAAGLAIEEAMPAPGAALMPWLLRRLQLTVRAAGEVAQAAHALRAAVARQRPHAD